MKTTASKTCACGVRIRYAAPAVCPVRYVDGSVMTLVLDMGSESTPHSRICRCE